MAIFIITAPSGAGKTTIAQEMQEQGLWKECISHTTRPMRKEQGEKDGVTYYFITESGFKEKLNNGEFAEHVEYDGNHYGISHAEIKRVIDNDKHVFIIADYDGHKQIKDLYPESVSVFLHMSKEECLMNMLRRGDKVEKAIKRINLFDEEIKNKGNFDYVIKNVYGKMEEVISTLSCIVVQYD